MRSTLRLPTEAHNTAHMGNAWALESFSRPCPSTPPLSNIVVHAGLARHHHEVFGVDLEGSTQKAKARREGLLR